MDDRDALLARIARLEALVAEQAAKIAEQAETIAAQAARIKELETELRRRGKKFTPQANKTPQKPKPDRRTKGFRKHPGRRRPAPSDADDIIEHDVGLDQCPDCGGTMTPTGQFTDHFVEDIPEPKIEVHRYRRHVCRCQQCGVTAQPRNDLAAPGAHVGPRANSLLKYAVVAYFNLAKYGAKLRTARGITTYVVIPSSRPCDGAVR